MLIAAFSNPSGLKIRHDRYYLARVEAWRGLPLDRNREAFCCDRTVEFTRRRIELEDDTAFYESRGSTSELYYHTFRLNL